MPSLLEEETIEVGSVQANVACGASLILDRLVMKRRFGGGRKARVCMALQADGVHVASIEQAWVWGSVRCVAKDAAFRLHGRVLEGEGTHLFRVAFDADGVTRVGGSQELVLSAAVWAVAVGALEQPLVDLMMHRLGELAADIGMAGVAESWLRSFEQADLLLWSMHGVAAEAANFAFRVSGAKEVVVIAVKLVATQAALICFFRRGDGEAEDLGLISAGVYVGLAWAMAAFAGGWLRSFVLTFYFEFPVGVGMEAIGLRDVAEFTGFGADVFALMDCRHLGLLGRCQ